MQDKKDQFVLTLLDEELDRLADTVPEIPYSALPLERSQIIFIVGRSEAFGYSADEILADRRLWINMIHAADQERVFAAFAKCKNQGTPFEIEYCVIHKDGSLRYVIDAGEPVFDEKGHITEIEGIITDVTEFKRAENLLLREKEFGVAELTRAAKSTAEELTTKSSQI